jgi:hypothetical protein
MRELDDAELRLRTLRRATDGCICVMLVGMLLFFADIILATGLELSAWGWIGIIAWGIALLAFLVFAHDGDVLATVIRRHRKHNVMLDYDGPFYLLLRPFSKKQIYEIMAQPPYRDDEEGRSSLPAAYRIGAVENDVIRALGQTAKIVTLGDIKLYDSNDHAVVTPAPGEDEWQPLVRLLSQRCKAVILLPEASEGLLLEMTLLQASEMYRKTIVVMPPLEKEETRESDVGTLFTGMHRDFWEEARAHLQSFGYNLPPASYAGAAFTVNRDFSVNEMVELSRSDDNLGLAPAINRLLGDTETGWSPLNEVYPLIANPPSPIEEESWRRYSIVATCVCWVLVFGVIPWLIEIVLDVTGPP